MKDYLAYTTELMKKFSPTKEIGKFMKIDDSNRIFMIGDDIRGYDFFEFSNLLSFELLEDDQSIIKGGLGRAVTGGLLFGGVGAVVGGVTGKKKSKGLCNSMKIRMTFKNIPCNTFYISLISKETKTNSSTYAIAQQSAQSCLSALQIIDDINQSENTEAQMPISCAPISPADEILKYKNLLDANIITQEEFDAKKKQLLGL